MSYETYVVFGLILFSFLREKKKTDIVVNVTHVSVMSVSFFSKLAVISVFCFENIYSDDFSLFIKGWTTSDHGSYRLRLDEGMAQCSTKEGWSCCC